jgi:hypothetical protein
MSSKADSVAFRYPTTLLLFCVIDAMSWHLGYADCSLGCIERPHIRRSLQRGIKQLKVWCCNLLTHNGMIAAGTVLTPENAGDAIETLNGEAVKITRTGSFQAGEPSVASNGQDQAYFAKDLAASERIDFSTDQVPRASSGCYVTPKIVKM